MTTELMPPERIPAGPRRDAYIALLRELGVITDDDTGEWVSTNNPPADPAQDVVSTDTPETN